MLVFTLFLAASPNFPPMASLIPSSTSPPSFPGPISPTPPDDHQRGRRQPAPHHKVYFPRLILPIPPRFPAWWTSPSASCPRHFHRCLRHAPTLAALWLPALLLLAVFTALGVGLWLSALNALYRDVKIRDGDDFSELLEVANHVSSRRDTAH